MTEPRSSLLDSLREDTKARRWFLAHKDYAYPEWCLLWPFSRDSSGYGMIGTGKAHRIMCEYKNGPAPADKPDASHECGKGHLGCVSPHHLIWKSRSDNLRDVARHGRRKKRFALTPSQVDEIRALKDRARVADIAEQFGVTVNTIYDILAGRIWKKPNSQFSFLSEKDVRLIRSTPWRTKSANQFAKELGVSQNVIQHIRDGNTYKWVSAVEDSE